ncbi:MAG: 30S ribosomal protein S12 methylthiotransferase RimO, partial [Planctomycetaceae bacterium]
DEQFEELLRFVDQGHFQRMGVFTYSLEPDTPAERLEGHLPEETKEARRDELMATQQRHAFAFGDSLVGYELDVLLDREAEAAGGWIGRTFADAPEIDGVVEVEGEGLATGQMVPVEILSRQGYDLAGAALE